MQTTPSVGELPSAPEPIDHLARWSAIVGRRRAQMEAAYSAAGLTNVDYWGRRAKQYREALHDRVDEDPFLRRIIPAVGEDTTLLDVGAGTGRHTLALAPRVRRVVAVDPSAAMLDFLRQDVEERRLTNVEVVQAEWLDAKVDLADIVICSHVLYPIGDVEPFIRKLAGVAKERLFIYLRVDPLPTDLGLWSEFYGVPLQAQPIHMDLLGVLAQIGVFPDVEVVEHRFTWTFATIDEAVEQVRNSLCLRQDDAEATAKLRRLLEERLVSWPNGRLGPQIGSARSAIVCWRPGRG